MISDIILFPHITGTTVTCIYFRKPDRQTHVWTVSHLLSCSLSSCYRAAPRCSSVYFLLISAVLFHSFGVWGVRQWSAFIQHQSFPLWFKPYLDTLNPPSPPLSDQPRVLNFVDVTPGIVKHQLSIINPRPEETQGIHPKSLVTRFCIV